MVGVMERTQEIIQGFRGPDPLIAEIERAHWIWAKTYATTAPHWYIVKHQHPGLFYRLAVAIKAEGEDREYRDTGQIHRYLVIGESQFWQIGVILYRARVEAR